jgi:hypothetical protein
MRECFTNEKKGQILGKRTLTGGKQSGVPEEEYYPEAILNGWGNLQDVHLQYGRTYI